MNYTKPHRIIIIIKRLTIICGGWSYPEYFLIGLSLVEGIFKCGRLKYQS